MNKLRATKIVQLNILEADDHIRSSALAALQPHGRVLADMRLTTAQDNILDEIFMKQPDLMYVEAVLVTEGINDNDDGFTHTELWKAQGTPILKPINIGHNDHDIVGVMYGVEARKLDGALVTEDDGEPFELVMRGVIWHYLPHIKGVAADLVDKFAQGQAFVSMECWFEGYNYGFYDQDGNLEEEIKRCDDTAFLEKHLRVRGGSGRYNGKRLGRALTGITFGGVGVVNIPANQRSLLLDMFVFKHDIEDNTILASDDSLVAVATDMRDINEVVRKTPEEEYYMNDTTTKTVANSPGADVRDEVTKGVSIALENRDRVEAAKRAEAELASAKQEATKLRDKLAEAERLLKATQKTVDQHFDELRSEAGAAGDTPGEIAKIDDAIRRAGDGDEVMQAKIAWITNSRAAANAKLADELKKIKAENDELRAKVRQSERTDEIQTLFAQLLSEEEIAETVKRGLAKSDADYQDWLEEKQLFAQKMKDKMADENEEDPKKKKGKAGHVVRQDTGGIVLQDNGVVLQPGHGKAPKSVPDPKTIASVDDITDLFEEVDEVDPAGANAANADESEERTNPYEAMAVAMLAKPDKDRAFGETNQGGNQ